MKQLLLIASILLAGISTYAQNLCDGHENLPFARASRSRERPARALFFINSKLSNLHEHLARSLTISKTNASSKKIISRSRERPARAHVYTAVS